MAKKMLINADMLLATPRRQETAEPTIKEVLSQENPVALIVEETTTEQTVIVPPITEVANVPIESPAAAKKIVEANTAKTGLKVGETRATFIVKEDSLEKIKSIAYWDRLNIKDVIQSAIDNYIAQYEQSKGEIQAMP